MKCGVWFTDTSQRGFVTAAAAAADYLVIFSSFFEAARRSGVRVSATRIRALRSHVLITGTVCGDRAWSGRVRSRHGRRAAQNSTDANPQKKKKKIESCDNSIVFITLFCSNTKSSRFEKWKTSKNYCGLIRLWIIRRCIRSHHGFDHFGDTALFMSFGRYF